MLLPVSLYIPFVQDWVCQGLVAVLNSTSDDIQYEVGSVRLAYPLQLRVNDVTMKKRVDGHVLLHVGRLQTGLDDIPLNQAYFVLNELHVSDVVVGMDSLTESVGLIGTLEALDVKRIELDTDSSRVYVRQVVVERPDLLVYLGPSVPDTTDTASPWTVGVERAVLHDGSVGLDMSDVSLRDALTSFSLSPYLDYRHLLLTHVDLEAEHIAYRADDIRARINLLRGREENSGLEVLQFSSGLSMLGQRITVDDLDLQLAPEDYLRGHAVMDLTMADSQPRGLVDAELQLAIDSANLVRLAAPYLPDLEQQWSIAGQSLVDIDARLTPDTLDLRRLALSIPQHLDIAAEGYGTHVLDSIQRQLAFTLHGDVPHGETLLTAFVARPEQRDYRLPDSLSVELEATQRNERITARLKLLQDGRQVANADVRYDLATEGYQLQAFTRAFDISRFVPAVAVDGVSARVQAEGRHFEPQRRSTRLEARLQVDSLYLTSDDGRRDSLQGLMAEASLVNNQYRAELTTAHPTLRLHTEVEGHYRRDTVSAIGHFDLRHADLAHLPLLSLDDQLGRLSFCSHFEAGYNWADNAHLRLDFDTLVYDEPELHQRFDLIRVGLDSRPDLLTADVTGGDAQISVRADQSIAQLPMVIDSLTTELQRQLASYRPDVASLFDRLPRMDVEVEMARQNPFSQTLERQAGITFDHLHLGLRHADQLTLSGRVVNYLDGVGGTSFDTVAVDLRPASLARSYDYRLHAQHHDFRDNDAYDIHASGRLMPDSLTAGVQYVNGRQKTIYDVLASLALGNDTMTLHLEQGPTLYEQAFTVNPDNYIRLMRYSDLEAAKPITKARLMLDGPRALTMHLYTRRMADSDVGNQLLFLVRNLDLDYARQLMEWEGDAVGRLNLTTSVDIFPDSLHARLRTGIKGFGLGGYKADTVALDMTALASPQHRDLSGFLALDSIVKVQMAATLADSVDVTAHIDRIPMPLLNAFLPSNMQLWGTASGHVDLRGKDLDHSSINGGLALNDAGLTYTDLDARLHFANDTLRFGHNRLLIRDYKITAANQNAVNIRGLVDMSKNLSDPAVSLTITGDNVMLIDNRRLVHHDQYLYGRLPLTTNIKVHGSVSNLDVSGRLSILSGTNLQYFMQDDPLESSSKVDNLVEFVRFDQIDRMISANRHLRRTSQSQASSDESLNVELLIDMANDARVTAHLAGTANNSVEIVGGAGLKLQCDKGGRMLMDGTYSMTSGKVAYKLPILPMVKNFGISNTSNLVWEGSDPGNPDINITATEEVKTTVNDDAGSRVVRFIVSINITGTLDALKMTFDCSAPDDGAISSDIATLDADERSKAALMLLIAQTYIGPGNSSSMGLGTANAALNSMLNREMDSMLSGMKGTNIDLGIDTYNTDAGNTRTNYSVKVSQNFLNDRFRATIGGQVSSGGDAGQSSGARLGDMSLEWLIKKDGSHLMKLFRTTNYESVLEGELIETGISYVQERSAYRLKQLFIPTSRKRQQKIQDQIRQMQLREEQAEREARRLRLNTTNNNDSTKHIQHEVQPQ